MQGLAAVPAHSSPRPGDRGLGDAWYPKRRQPWRGSFPQGPREEISPCGFSSEGQPGSGLTRGQMALKQCAQTDLDLIPGSPTCWLLTLHPQASISPCTSKGSHED